MKDCSPRFSRISFIHFSHDVEPTLTPATVEHTLIPDNSDRFASQITFCFEVAG
jgi:hypothetical protein